MNVSIDPGMQEIIDERLESGQYDSAEDVVRAALAALKQRELYGDFRAGELDELLAEGERGIKEHGTSDADEALSNRRERRARLHE